MSELIPSIIAKDFTDFQAKVDLVKEYVSWVHLDVVDGKFAPNLTWGDPTELKSYKSPVNIEVHLMVQNPEAHIADWVSSGAKRIFFHHESTAAHGQIIELCKTNGVEVGIALLPETIPAILEPLIEKIDAVLLLGVTPGFYGSTLQENIFQKIHSLHEAHPNITIEVDGGMNPDTAPRAVKEGASLIVSGSYIFNSANIFQAVGEMKKAIR